MGVARVVVVFGVSCLLTLTAGAADVSVDCNKKGSINEALAKLSPTGPNTVRVSGACNENIHIQGFDRLTLIGDGNASITGTTADVAVVLAGAGSDEFRLENITVNGTTPRPGVLCGNFSVCRLVNVTVQGSTGAGVVFRNSSGSIQGGAIQNNREGLSLSASRVDIGGAAEIRNNTQRGITAVAGSVLIIDGASIANNGFDGIALETGSAMTANNLSVTGNQGGGIALNNTSSLRMANSSITGNTSPGLFIGNLSFVRLLGGNTVTGNATVQGEVDIRCNASTSGVSGPQPGVGSTTNCTIPAP
jgi:hypothetical protein